MLQHGTAPLSPGCHTYPAAVKLYCKKYVASKHRRMYACVHMPQLPPLIVTHRTIVLFKQRMLTKGRSICNADQALLIEKG